MEPRLKILRKGNRMRHLEAPPFWVPGDVNSGATKYKSES